MRFQTLRRMTTGAESLQREGLMMDVFKFLEPVFMTLTMGTTLVTLGTLVNQGLTYAQLQVMVTPKIASMETKVAGIETELAGMKKDLQWLIEKEKERERRAWRLFR